MREFYTDLSTLKSDAPVFNKAIKMASRALNDIDSLRDPTLHPAKKFRGSGGGRKAKSPEVREALFTWFVDVREALRGRLPKRVFKLKAKSL